MALEQPTCFGSGPGDCGFACAQTNLSRCLRKAPILGAQRQRRPKAPSAWQSTPLCI